MSARASALLAAFALAVASFALLTFVWGWGGERPARGRARDAAPARAAPAGHGPRLEGASARPRAEGPALREGSSAPAVSGRVVDPSGEAIIAGRVALWCLPAGEASGAPIADGALELDASGEFRGPACEGTICAEFVHPSMVQRGAWVLEPGRSARLVADALERRGGAVVDQDDAPVAGARLQILALDEAEDPAASPFTSQSTVADAEGNFSFALRAPPPCDPCREASGRCVADDASPRGEMLLVARAPGHRVGERRVELASDAPWRIELEDPAPPVRGRLVDDSDEAYPRAKILARSEPRPYEVHQASVVGDRFELTDLGDGPYELRAIQDGVELAVRAGVLAGEDVELGGGLPAAGVALRLRVLDAAGAALVGAEVDGGPFVAAEADSHGEVEAAHVLPGPYNLRIWPPGRGPERHHVVVSDGASDVTIEVKVGAQLREPR
ncbi:MAG: carboxypeptidase-like regulatory domain-containing protein [Nannocystaceae bacterium]